MNIKINKPKLTKKLNINSFFGMSNSKMRLRIILNIKYPTNIRKIKHCSKSNNPKCKHRITIILVIIKT